MGTVAQHTSTTDNVIERAKEAARAYQEQAAKARDVTIAVERAAAAELVRRNDLTVAGRRFGPERRQNPPAPYTGPERRRR